MTDATASQIGDVIVTGQRRRDRTASFPSLPPTLWFPPPYAAPEATRDSSWVERPPCHHLPLKRRWNQDAAAASSIGAFLSHALGLGSLNEGDVTPMGPVLTRREFGAGLRRVGSSVELGPITHGGVVTPGQTPSVTIIHPNLNLPDWMGDVHTHPSGDPRPSAGDWSGFQAMLSQLQANGFATANR